MQDNQNSNMSILIWDFLAGNTDLNRSRRLGSG